MTHENVFDEEDLWQDPPPVTPPRPATRAARQEDEQRPAQAAPPTPPPPPGPCQEEQGEETDGGYEPPPRQEEHAPEADNIDEPGPAPNPNKNLCQRCHTMFKLVDGTRTCMHEMLERDDTFVPDMEDGFLDIRDEHRKLYGTIAYARGLNRHPYEGRRP